MATFVPSGSYDAEVYQIATDDPCLGGPDGILNSPFQSLVNRTDYLYVQKANLNSPAFTGTPTAPTLAADISNTGLATTAWVLGQASNAVPAMDGAATSGASKRFARDDHVHATDTSRAPVSSEGNKKGVVFIGSATTLTIAQAGCFIEMGGSVSMHGAFTVTLPSSIGPAVGGSVYLIWNNSADAQTVNAPPSTTTIFGLLGAGIASFSMPAGGFVELISDDYNWIVTRKSW